MPPEPNKQPTILLELARSRLSTMWFIGSGLIVMLIIGQSVMGKYQNKVQEVWGWVLPTILPSLSLILSVLGASALANELETVRVKRSFFRIAYSLSVVYLFLVVMTIVIEPLTTFESLELLRLSNLWLAPLQGLVTLALGVLFFTKAKEQGE